jgi:tetratricopeptide (TPR) repeat protein
VLGRRADRPPIPPSDFHGKETRLVGRGAEMQRVLDEIEGALSEREPRLLTLVGPPGVGRSRLLAEIAREWDKRAAPCHLMAAQASPLTTRASYRLCASLLASRFHLHDDDPVDVIRRKLGRRLRGAEPSLFPTRSGAPDEAPSAGAGAGPESAPPVSLQGDDDLVRIAAELTPLLGATPATTQTPDSLAPDEGWSHAKNRIAAAVARLLGAAAAHAPVILLCDDIHWADDASLDLLDELVLRLGDAPVAVVCAARPELYDRRPHWGEGRASYRRIDVGPLERRHVEEMARDRLRNVPDLPPEVVRLLAERAEGNALTLEESLHLLVEAGVVDRTDPSRWRVHGDRLQALALPPTMHGIVQARLDRLDPDERTALAAASVIGRTFWEGAVEHLRADPGSVGGSLPAPRSSAAETLARLRARQWIRARELSSLPGEREFVFAESATQEVAYDTLSQRVRRRLHHRLTGWLAERLPPDAAAAQLALHHDRAGDRGAAVTAYARAATRAATLGQNADALRQLERARDIHDQSTDPSATKREAATTGANASSSADPSDRRVAGWQDRTRLRLDLGDVLRRVGQLDDAERQYDEARALLLGTERRRGGSVDLASVLQWQARIDFRMALAQRVRGATEPALELSRRAIAIAEQAGAVDETPAMWAVVAALHRRARDLDACRAAAISGLRVCRAAKVRDERWRESVSRLLTTLGGVFLFRRQPIRAERCYRQAARVVDERTQPEAASYALNDLAVLRAVNGDMEGAREMFARALGLRERMGDLRSVAVTLSNLAEAELQLGHVRAALEHARRATGLAEQVHAEADLPEVRRVLAGALAASGDHAAAIDWGLRALEAAEVPSARVYLADAAIALARICRDVAAGSTDEPLRERAREVARTLAARLELQADVHPRKLEECRVLLADVVL